MNKKIICIECPQGCEITVTGEEGNFNIVGNSCLRGKMYAENEAVCPRRVLTTTIRNGDVVVPVKSDKPIKKEDINKVINLIKCVKITLPIKIGDCICKNIVEDINIIATDNRG